MNKFIIIAGVIVAVLAAAGVGAFFFYKNVFLQADEAYVIDFIRKYPEKASIRIVRNDSVVTDFHSDRMMPLASTVKIIIAVEFAQQAATGKVDANELIPLDSLALFYIPNTDGGAHPQWLQHIQKNEFLHDGGVSLLQVAKSMVTFSSNANTEYLMMRLGLENINRNLKELGFTQHEELYPFVSSLYVFRNPANIPEDQFYKMLKQTSLKEYVDESSGFHRRVRNDRDSSFRKTFMFPSLTLQRIWSARLPRSTASEYVRLLKKLNSKSFLPEPVQKHLDAILEWPMELNPRNKDRFRYIGAKGGSTAFVLTYAMYACDNNGNRSEIVTFFDDLAPLEGQRLRTALNSFQLNVLTKQEFREKLRENLSLLR
ncbi:MAG: serine hydrolase [Bacteroidota bacterium]